MSKYASITELLRLRFQWRLSTSSSKRITFINQFFPPDFASTGQLLDELTVHLSSLGYQCQILCGLPAYAYNQPLAPRIEFHSKRLIRRTIASRIVPKRIRGRAINGILFCIRIFSRTLRSSRRGDLIVCTTEPPYLPVVSALVCYAFRTPLVCLLFDIYPDVVENLNVLSRNHPLIWLWRRLNSWALRRADKIIVLSDPMKDRLCNSTSLDRDKVLVIPPWSDPNRIYYVPPEENWFISKYDLTDNFVVLYSGNCGRCHDMKTIIEAASVLSRDQRIKFVFIGDGPAYGYIQQYVADHKLSNCLFLPYQERSVLPFSLSSSNLSLVSVKPEATTLVVPSKLFGHMAVGSPVAAICPEDSHLSSIINYAKCGRTFANGDSFALASWITELSNNPEELQKLSANARNSFAERFTLQIAASMYSSCFASILE